jgi:hypothetical protein
MKRIAALLVGLMLMFAATSSAMAQESSECQAYNPQTSCTVTTSSASSGTLPFTGLDVALLVAGGAALLGAGLVVRRLSRSHQ